MTTNDYHLVMKNSVRVAELKSRLSEYLRRVRRGETVTVLVSNTRCERWLCDSEASATGLSRVASGTA